MDEDTITLWDVSMGDGYIDQEYLIATLNRLLERIKSLEQRETTTCPCVAAEAENERLKAALRTIQVEVDRQYREGHPNIRIVAKAVESVKLLLMRDE